MTDQVRVLRDEISSLQGVLAKIKARHLNRTDEKRKIGTVVQDYFRTYRPAFYNNLTSEAILLPIDQEMQDLLRLAQGRTPLVQYKKALKKLAHLANELEVACVAQPTQRRPTDSRMNERDKKIIETLEKLLPGAACAYRQGLRDLSDKERVSWRGPAVEFREGLRETLDHLAPDDQVLAQPGFKLENDLKKPTMKQKMIFILSSRGRPKSSIETPKKTIGIIDEMTGSLLRSVYERASVSTHVPTGREEVQKIKNFVEILLAELLELPE